MEQLILSKNRIRNDQWKCLLNHLVPIFPVLYCYANHTSTFGQIIFSLFDPDQAEKFHISRLMVCCIFLCVLNFGIIINVTLN